MSNAVYRKGVGAVIVNHEKRIWIGQRINKSNVLPENSSLWQMPQGGIDSGEKPETALFRELLEETGIKKERLSYLAESNWLNYDFPPQIAQNLQDVWGGTYKGQTQKWYLLSFKGANTDIDIHYDPNHPEFSDWRWAKKEEVINLVIDFKRALYKNVFQQFDPFL